jgi:Ser/Thr protein kinase RdoA (MazF antagonist)
MGACPHVPQAAQSRDGGPQPPQLHEAAEFFAGTLRSPHRLEEVRSLCRVAAGTWPDHTDRLLLALERLSFPTLERQALHGDAHLANVVNTTDGLTWLDWDDCWHGPVAWDLASLEHRRRVFGELREPISAALRAYGSYDSDAVDAYAPLVTAWTAAWGLVNATQSSGVDDRTSHRLKWLSRS